MIQEPLINSTKRLVSEMLPVLLHKLTDGVPFAFWGHSVGAWVAFEMAMTLRSCGFPQPCALVVGTMPAPTLPVAERPWPHNGSRDLSGAEFQAECASWDVQYSGPGGRAEAAFKRWEAHTEKMFRADFALVDQYDFEHQDAPPLAFPIRAFHGKVDTKMTSKAQIDLWALLTTSYSYAQMSGGHLTSIYNEDHRNDYFFQVCTDLSEVFDVQGPPTSATRSPSAGEAVENIDRYDVKSASRAIKSILVKSPKCERSSSVLDVVSNILDELGYPVASSSDLSMEFFDYDGVDSLMMMEFTSRLSSHFDKPFTPILLNQYPNMKSLCGFLESLTVQDSTCRSTQQRKKRVRWNLTRNTFM
jgi:surfactin synthase thioesterase subunit/acyl carrier protein